MKWKLLQWGFLILLCGEILTMTRADDEKAFEGDVTRQGVQVPLQVLRHLADPTATSPHNNTDGPEERGVIGSHCNSSADCDYPTLCWSDGYCHCWNGYDYDGICFTTSLTWTSTLAFAAAGLVFFIAICILAVNCFKQPSWRNHDIWRCQCCGAVVNGRQRRGSCEKTPAFTMQVHYASQEPWSPGEDVQESSSYDLGGAVPRRHQTFTMNNETVSGSSSANTNITSVNGSISESDTAHTSLPPPSSPTPSPPPYSPPCASPSPIPIFYSLSSSSSPADTPPLIRSPSTSLLISGSSTSVLPPHTPSCPVSRDSSDSRDANGCCDSGNSNTKLTDASELRPSTFKSSSETTSTAVDAPGACTHERCQLCLPKPPSSPVSTPSRRKSNTSNVNGENTLLPSTDTPYADSSIELTQF